MNAPDQLDLLFSKTARRDPLIWAMLVIGLLFAWLSFQVDPQFNCDDSGDCNSWLVDFMRAIGGFFALAGAALLIGNHARGSGVDPQSGELVWWYGSMDKVQRHPLSDISRIRLDLDMEIDDIHLFDGAGERLPFTGIKVIPWPYQDWAARLIERYPHIELEVRN
jgi:hypothetical protein